MLKALRAGLGFRVATAIAVFAALCLMAPPAVMAFGHGKTTAHCLTNADVAGHGDIEDGPSRAGSEAEAAIPSGDGADELLHLTQVNAGDVPTRATRAGAG